MEKALEHRKKYSYLQINGIMFKDAQVFIREKYIELVDFKGSTFAIVYIKDISTVEF